MRPLFSPQVGRLGFAVAAAGVLGTAISVIRAWSTHGTTPYLALFAGSFMYLIGAFMGVGAFGYGAQSRSLIIMWILRVTFAATVVWAILLSMRPA